MDALTLTTVGDRLSSLGVEDVTTLLAERHALVVQVAPLRAFSQTFSAMRDAEKAKLALVIKAGLDEALQAKISDAALTKLTEATPEYHDSLRAAQEKLVELAILEDQITAINERIRRADAELRFATAELRISGNET